MSIKDQFFHSLSFLCLWLCVFFFVRIVAAKVFVADLELVVEFRSWKLFFFLFIWNLMAAVAACKRVGLLGTNSAIALTRFGGYYGASKSFPPISSFRHFSHLVKSNGQRLFLVDTLALVICFPLLNSFFLLWIFFLFPFHVPSFPCLVAVMEKG